MRSAMRKWKRGMPWILLACVIFGCAMTLYTCFYQADYYRACYTFYALPDLTDAERSPLEGARMLSRDLHALTETASFRQTVLKNTRSDGMSYVQVKGMDGSHLLEVEVVGPDAKLIAGLANAIGRELCNKAPEMLNVRDVREIQEAEVASEPFGPNRPLKIALTVLATFVIGLLFSLLFASGRQPLSFDDERADEFFLGAIPDLTHPMKQFEKKSRKGRKNGTLLDGMNRLMRECVRKTALSLRTAEPDGRVVLLASQKEDPQTPAAAALIAAELAQQGFRVLLLETDSDRSAVSGWIGVRAQADLYDYLKGRAALADIMQRTPIETLAFVDALHPEITVADYAAQPSFADFLTSAKQHFDLIFIHARDMARTSDAAMLSLLSDTVVFTVRDKRSTLDEVEDTARQLANLGLRANGVIFTGVHPSQLVQDD